MVVWLFVAAAFRGVVGVVLLYWRSVIIMKLYLCHKDEQKMKWTLGPRGQQKVPLNTLFLFVTCHGGAPREKGEGRIIEHSIQRLIQLHELLCMACFIGVNYLHQRPPGQGRVCGCAPPPDLRSSPRVPA